MTAAKCAIGGGFIVHTRRVSAEQVGYDFYRRSSVATGPVGQTKPRPPQTMGQEFHHVDPYSPLAQATAWVACRCGSCLAPESMRRQSHFPEGTDPTCRTSAQGAQSSSQLPLGEIGIVVNGLGRELKVASVTASASRGCNVRRRHRDRYRSRVTHPAGRRRASTSLASKGVARRCRQAGRATSNAMLSYRKR